MTVLAEQIADSGIDPLRRYEGFGLSIASGIALPELHEAAGEGAGADACDVIVRLAPVDGPMPPADQLRLVRFDAQYLYFAWNGFGRIRVTDARLIEIDPLPGVDPLLAGLFLLGPVMAAVLHARGYLVLHGSAIEIAPGRAMLCVGDNGQGKSTLAGAFLKAGHVVLADDVIAIPPPQHAQRFRVQPAFPAIKLSREAMAAFAPLPGEVMPAVPAGAAKCRVRLREQPRGPIDIAHVCVVERAVGTALGRLEPAARLTALLRHAYILKFGADVLSGERGRAHFTRCAALASAVPVSRLAVPGRLDQLGDAVETIRALVADDGQK